MSATAVGYHSSRTARKDAQKRDRESSEAESRRQAQIDANIRRVRSTYGIGDDLGELQAKRSALQGTIGNQPETVEETYTTGTPSSGSGRSRGRSRPATRTRTVANPATKESSAELSELNRLTLDASEADKNRRELDGYLNDYEGAVTDISIQDTQDQYGDAKLQQRRQLARQGLAGGSVDYQARRQQLEQYVAGRQAAVAGGRQARQTLQGNMTRDRQNLEGQIQSGTQVNPNFREIEGGLRDGLSTANASIGPTVAGNLFTVAGNTAAQDQLNRGRRRAPPGTSTAPASGNITGPM